MQNIYDLNQNVNIKSVFKLKSFIYWQFFLKIKVVKEWELFFF